MIPVFETALVEDGRIRLRGRHLSRLAASGGSPEQVAELDRLLTEVCARPEQPFVVRIDVSDAGLVVMTRPLRSTSPVALPIKRIYDPGVELRHIKIADRSWVDVVEAEFDVAEVLLVSEDDLVGETTRASIIVRLANGSLVVPRLAGILQGVTRSWVLDETGAAEADVHLADLYAAQGAAVLTAGRGVIPIASVDGQAIARDAIFDELQTVWRALP